MRQENEHEEKEITSFTPVQADYDDVEKAFSDGRISLEQFIEILTDNFGFAKTCEIISYNIQLALQSER